jgi:hypothetical protein
MEVLDLPNKMGMPEKSNRTTERKSATELQLDPAIEAYIRDIDRRCFEKT